MNLPKAILTANKSNCNILIFGQKGYGKTSLARGLMRGIDRLIILDTLMYEYNDEDGRVVESYEEILSELREAIEKKRGFRIVARTPKDERFFRLLDQTEHTTFLIEEMDTYSDLYHIPELIADHYRYGRHKENNVIALSRHAQEIHPEIRKGSDVVISFRQEEPNVLRYLAKINYRITEELPRLERGEYRILKGGEYLKEFLEQQTGEKIELPKEQKGFDLFLEEDSKL